MQKFVLTILFVLSCALSAFPDAGVFGFVGDDFDSVLMQQQNILSFVQSLSLTCCGTGVPVEICTGTPITQADVTAATFVINASGTYCVEENLTAGFAGTSMIDIQADDVTLNLNGFTLDGNNSVNQVVNVATRNNIVIKNGVVQNSSANGINISNSSNMLLEGCDVINNALNGIIIQNSEGTIIGKSTADYSQLSNNGGSGVFMVNCGALMRWCNAEANTDIGFYLEGSLGLLTECSASSNGLLPVQTVLGLSARWGYLNNEGILSGQFNPALSTTQPAVGTTIYNVDMGGNT